MDHYGQRRTGATLSILLIPWLLLVTACQDNSGPSFVAAPDEKVAAEGKRPQPPPPADPAIAYVGGRRDEYGLRVMNADGSNQTTIFFEGGDHPSWSPEGDAIAFDGPNGLWRIDVSVVDGVPTGTNARMLVDGGPDCVISRAAWSPNGDRVAYHRYGLYGQCLRSIESVPADGGDPVVLYTSESGVTVDFPTWSPDGTKIAFVEGRLADSFIRLVDVTTGVATTILDVDEALQIGGYPKFLDWARTQDALMFSVGDAQHSIYVMDVPDGTPTYVVGDERDRAAMPTWSPDDSEIVFGEWGAMFRMDLASGTITRLGGKGPRANGLFPDWRRF